MKHGQIAGNTSINSTIYRCFGYIRSEDRERFVRKFAEQPHDQDQVMHTFRELVLGAFLGAQGLDARNEIRVVGKTPDWCILDDQAIVSIVELVNFHVDRTTYVEMEARFREGRSWWGRPKSHVNRLYPRLQEKATAYKSAAEQLNVPYVIAVFGDFFANVHVEEVKECLFHVEHGLFKLYSRLGGVLFFEESAGTYHFTYLGNPQSMPRIEISGGIF